LQTVRKRTTEYLTTMPVGVVTVVRDFVNHHDHDGKHVKCLHWVMQWRDVEGGPLKILKLRHYCDDLEL
jgi:hypothetical protein